MQRRAIRFKRHLLRELTLMHYNYWTLCSCQPETRTNAGPASSRLLRPSRRSQTRTKTGGPPAQGPPICFVWESSVHRRATRWVPIWREINALYLIDLIALSFKKKKKMTGCSIWMCVYNRIQDGCHCQLTLKHPKIVNLLYRYRAKILCGSC